MHPGELATTVLGRVPAAPDTGRTVRLGLHLVLAGLPLLAISAHVFGLLALHLSTALVVVPLGVFVVLRAVFDPVPEERLVLRGAGWGMVATLVYDAFRLDTVYLLHWWGDFIPRLGTWVLDADPDAVAAGAVAGYLWRYAGDGAGLGVVFFVLAAATDLRGHGRRVTVAAATAFAVCPVWAGLVATVALAPRGQASMFPLTPTTVTLSLVGHLVFGVVLGLGCARGRDLERCWPWPPLVDLRDQLRRARTLRGADVPAPRPIARSADPGWGPPDTVGVLASRRRRGHRPDMPPVPVRPARPQARVPAARHPEPAVERTEELGGASWPWRAPVG